MHDLELIQLIKRFGNDCVVSDVSLQVKPGEFVSFLGPSGCGKTTTLRMIAGFEQPTSGEILLKGSSVTGVPPHKREVNTVFQHYALFPHMTVRDNIGYGLRIRRRPKTEIGDRVRDALDMVALGGLGDRYPHQLSGGQQQRVALARALVNHPAILLLDEPLGALDLQVRKRMQNELKRIQRDVGITFIYVTHDQEEALTLSDRIVVMNKGKVEQVGTPAEVYSEPATRFVLDFIGSANSFDGQISEIDGSYARIELGPTTKVIVPAQGNSHKGADVTFAIRPEKISLGSTPTSDNCLECTIEDAVFQGPALGIRLKTDDGLVLNATRSSADAGGAVQPGQKVWAHWLPEGGLLFAR